MQQIFTAIASNVMEMIGKVPIWPVGVLLGTYVLATFIKALSSKLRKRHMQASPALCKKPILTANEQEFFGRLLRALPEYHVFPQVAFSALLNAPKELSWFKHSLVRGRFNRKFVDYVICKRGTLEVVAIVELDDKTHRADKDQKRDAMLTSAGYRVERFQSKNKPSEAEIVARVTPTATV